MSDREDKQEQKIPLPPPSFEFLVLSLSMQAQSALGLLHFGPKEEQPEADLDLARHSIDLLALLEEKTRGNLSLEEQRMLGNTLTELRFRFVQASQAPKVQQAS